MADIFISYASADRDRARVLADALATQGWSVWWDRTIPPGRQFDEVIEEELAAAGCVVVLWSRASVASTWVKTEAAEARDRRMLVPVLIDDVKIPLEFKRVQAADLSQWRAGPDPQFDEFCGAVARQLSRRGQRRADSAEVEDGVDLSPTPEAQRKRAVRGPTVRRLTPMRSAAAFATITGLAMVVLVLAGYVVYKETRGGLEAERASRPPAAQKAPDAPSPPLAEQRRAEGDALRTVVPREGDPERGAVSDPTRLRIGQAPTEKPAATPILTQPPSEKAVIPRVTTQPPPEKPVMPRVATQQPPAEKPPIPQVSSQAQPEKPAPLRVATQAPTEKAVIPQGAATPPADRPVIAETAPAPPVATTPSLPQFDSAVAPGRALRLDTRSASAKPDESKSAESRSAESKRPEEPGATDSK